MIGKAWGTVTATALLALTLAGCGDDEPAAPPATTITVNFQLADYDTAFYECDGSGGYSDIGAGTPVTIKNGSGEVLGAATLGPGKPSTNGVQAAYCDWTVQITGVPTGQGFYSAEVGSRGAITSSEADLAAGEWEFNVTLGSL